MNNPPPLYTVMVETVGWTLGRTAGIPKSHRFTFGQRLDNLTLDALMLVVRAVFTTGPARRDLLKELNLHIEQLRVLWRFPMPASRSRVESGLACASASCWPGKRRGARAGR